jgi:hypothetical protein
VVAIRGDVELDLSGPSPLEVAPGDGTLTITNNAA